MRHYWEEFKNNLLRSRMFVMLVGICLLFFLLVVRLFSLQIIHGSEYQESTSATTLKTLEVPAARGNIYDRYGRPLAVNRVAYSVQIDNSITLDLSTQRSDLILSLCEDLFAQGCTLTDELPISADGQSFVFEGTEREQRKALSAWQEEIGLPKEYTDSTPSEILSYLYSQYNIPDSLTEAQKRAVLWWNLDLSDQNIMVLTLAEKLAEYGETTQDELPIDTEAPYDFTYQGNTAKEESFKASMEIEEEDVATATGAETLEYLRDYFGLPAGLPAPLLRSAVGIRYSLFQERYYQYKSVVIATDISEKTLAYVEENQDIFPCVIISTSYLREYPEGEYFSHILGYIRQMTEDDYANYKDDVDENGDPIYTSTDIVGQDGLEKLYERELKGIDGEMSVEVDSSSRRIGTIQSTDPVPGNDIFLTLDARLQQVAFDALEGALTDSVLSKLQSSGRYSVSQTDLFISMIEANHLSSSKILSAKSGAQKELLDQAMADMPDFDPESEDAVTQLKDYLIDGVQAGKISYSTMLLAMEEQKLFELTDEERSGLQNGTVSPFTVVLNMLQERRMTAADTALDPCTGAVVVSKVDSGEVLALVSYPSYDNNELVNQFNSSYYNTLLEDTNTPLVNRPLKQKKAPGSTLKMVTALAGLETGAIDARTIIDTQGIFRDAGTPYARCWIYSNTGGNHGMVNVTEALEVSCNYFFYTVGYLLGNQEEGTTEQAITTLNEYMAAFGLNQTTGMELDEYSPTMASPSNKERLVKSSNPDATTSQTRWTDGDTIRAAIGQSVNSYTPAQINRYIATLANGGTLYKMHLLDRIVSSDGTVLEETEEVVENVMEFDQENLNAVYEGMELVGSGSRGTLRTSFSDYPIRVAVKSGTAEEQVNRNSHTWLVCFAPADDPQIAITVLIPFGENSGTPAPTVVKSIISAYMGLDSEGSNDNMEIIWTE